jgi:DNA primase catalytic subunit
MEALGYSTVAHYDLNALRREILEGVAMSRVPAKQKRTRKTEKAPLSFSPEEKAEAAAKEKAQREAEMAAKKKAAEEARAAKKKAAEEARIAKKEAAEEARAAKKKGASGVYVGVGWRPNLQGIIPG